MKTFSGPKYFSSCLRGDGKACFFILCVPQHTAGLLLIVAVGTSARLILFFISTHRHTRKQLVVSASNIFHGRQPQARKSNVITQESKKYQKVCFITKIICEHKQMWSTNMPFNWEFLMVPPRAGRQWKATVENKASAATTTLHFCSSDWQGLGLRPQDSNRNHSCCLSETHRQTVSQEQVVLGFRGECCLSTPSSLLCLCSAASFKTVGMKPLPTWHEIPNPKTYRGRVG